MADIELVIKIPKAEYELIVNDEACGLNVLTRAIANGTSLEDIKAEIASDWMFDKFPSAPFTCGLRKALEIIDKHIGKETE